MASLSETKQLIGRRISGKRSGCSLTDGIAMGKGDDEKVVRGIRS
jgi:hypothetical protein